MDSPAAASQVTDELKTFMLKIYNKKNGDACQPNTQVMQKDTGFVLRSQKLGKKISLRKYRESQGKGLSQNDGLWL